MIFVVGTKFYVIIKPKKEAFMLFLDVPACVVVSVAYVYRLYVACTYMYIYVHDNSSGSTVHVHMYMLGVCKQHYPSHYWCTYIL